MPESVASVVISLPSSATARDFDAESSVSRLATCSAIRCLVDSSPAVAADRRSATRRSSIPDDAVALLASFLSDATIDSFSATMALASLRRPMVWVRVFWVVSSLDSVPASESRVTSRASAVLLCSSADDWSFASVEVSVSASVFFVDISSADVTACSSRDPLSVSAVLLSAASVEARVDIVPVCRPSVSFSARLVSLRRPIVSISVFWVTPSLAVVLESEVLAHSRSAAVLLCNSSDDLDEALVLAISFASEDS